MWIWREGSVHLQEPIQYNQVWVHLSRCALHGELSAHSVRYLHRKVGNVMLIHQQQLNIISGGSRISQRGNRPKRPKFPKTVECDTSKICLCRKSTPLESVILNSEHDSSTCIIAILTVTKTTIVEVKYWKSLLKKFILKKIRFYYIFIFENLEWCNLVRKIFKTKKW